MFKLRDSEIAEKIINYIKSRGRKFRFMHVCGTHQDTIVRHGLDEMLLEANVEVREGPGCPVCVTTGREIEMMKTLAYKGKIVCVYGDMFRVRVLGKSLESVKSEGYDVRVVYSVADAVEIAEKNKDRDVVFFGVGFETTAPSTAYSIINSPDNFYVLSAHRYVPPAMDALLSLGRIKLDGIILPGHVSTVIGQKPWEFLSEKYKIPQVIAGFEPLDVLIGIKYLVEMAENGVWEVRNEYTRAVKYEGNIKAQKFMDETFEPASIEWRGFPEIPNSWMKIRGKYEDKDALRVFVDELEEVKNIDIPEPPGCKCGEVIRGEIYPWECPLFGKACKPSQPVGPCMVSAEGACAIEYKYGKMWRKFTGK